MHADGHACLHGIGLPEPFPQNFSTLILCEAGKVSGIRLRFEVNGVLIAELILRDDQSVGNQFGVAVQANTQRLRDGFASEVVFGRPKTSADDHDIGSKQGVLCGGNQMTEVIADDAFENYIDSEQVELLGQVERVRVHAVGSEHLGPDRNDFGVHALRV